MLIYNTEKSGIITTEEYIKKLLSMHPRLITDPFSFKFEDLDSDQYNAYARYNFGFIFNKFELETEIPRRDYKSEYFESIFEEPNLTKIKKSIIGLNVQDQTAAINRLYQELLRFNENLNKSVIDVEFFQDSLIRCYHDDYPLVHERIEQEIILFKNAFYKRPRKFLTLLEMIPINWASCMDFQSVVPPKVVCHSVGTIISGDAYKYAHEIFMARAISARFGARLFVKLYQDDKEVKELLNLFNYNSFFKRPIYNEIIHLMESNWSCDEWDIQTGEKIAVGKDCFYFYPKDEISEILSIAEKIKILKKVLKFK